MGRIKGRVHLISYGRGRRRHRAERPRAARLRHPDHAQRRRHPRRDHARSRPASRGSSGPTPGTSATRRRTGRRRCARSLGEVDLILVVGAQNSSNSNRLREIGEAAGTPSYLIESAEASISRWLDGVRTVGITAGASAPELLVQDLIRKLAAALRRQRRDPRAGIEENVHFRLPPELADQAGRSAVDRRQHVIIRARRHGHPASPAAPGRRLRPQAEAPRARQVSPGADARAAVPLQSGVRRLRQDRLPDADPESTPERPGVPGRGRRVRRAGGLDSGRRAVDPQGHRRDRQGSDRAPEVRLPVHQRAPGREEDRPVRAQPVPHLLDPSRRAARASRPLGLPGRRVRPRRRGDPAAARARLSGQRQRHAVRRRGAGRRRGLLRLRHATNSTSRASPCRPATPTSGRPIRSTFSIGARPRSCSATIFRRGQERKRAWQLSHSSLYLDFLAGNQQYRCTPWGNPTRNVFGWQRPCYLLAEGYAASFKELMAETDWDSYGTGNYEKCANCMAHCGYEATAVTDALVHPLKALRVGARPRSATEGPMAPEIPLDAPAPGGVRARPAGQRGDRPSARAPERRAASAATRRSAPALRTRGRRSSRAPRRVKARPGTSAERRRGAGEPAPRRSVARDGAARSPRGAPGTARRASPGGARDHPASAPRARPAGSPDRADRRAHGSPGTAARRRLRPPPPRGFPCRPPGRRSPRTAPACRRPSPRCARCPSAPPRGRGRQRSGGRPPVRARSGRLTTTASRGCARSRAGADRPGAAPARARRRGRS